MNQALQKLLDICSGTPYEGQLYLVGGCVRDELLGLPESPDYDIVLEQDSIELANLIYRSGAADFHPVTYPRFGTALVSIFGVPIEFVTARSESYDETHRKPDVKKATLKDDVYRRDFTINTLLKNLCSGEVLDITGSALSDLKNGIIRTPVEPERTFYDDPLRMLRAVRFAARFGFAIEENTRRAIIENSSRLSLISTAAPVVSAERIRDEFIKIMSDKSYVSGIEMLSTLGLLGQFIPELETLRGVTQNNWHTLDVWDHTILALRNIDPSATTATRLGMLFHDIGKPATRTIDDRGIHFYEHQFVGADMTNAILKRLKFKGEDIREIESLVRLHMRIGEYKEEWADAPVKRLMRAISSHEVALFTITKADLSAMRQDVSSVNLASLEKRMQELNEAQPVSTIDSPLNGSEIIETLGCEPGPIIKTAKEFLLNQVIEGKLEQKDKVTAIKLLLEWKNTNA